MKKTILLALLLLLPACKERESSQASSTAGQLTPAAPAEALVHTEAFPSDAILLAASADIKARRPLSTRYLERCWEKEQGRPQVQEACALVWSIGAETSAKMTELCHALGTRQGRRTQPLALACFRHEATLNGLNELELISIAELLGGAPLWVKAVPLQRWLKAHASPARSSVPRLLEAFFPAWKERLDLDPLSYASAYYALELLGVSEAQEWLARECSPQIEGVGLSRCWRHLSALADPAYRESFRTHAFRLPPQDQGWSLFRRNFPERSVFLPQP